MRKNREFTEGAFYHVTSRTNDKIRVFENKLGRKIMLMVLHDAKAKFHFTLANFCVMPTHIHLLIKPEKCAGLSAVMQWIKANSAKRWNGIHGSTDHLWGHRFYAGLIKDQHQFDFVMDYIDQNPVVVGLAETPAEWKASGAYYKAKGIEGLVDFGCVPDISGVWHQPKSYIKLLSPIPPAVSKLLPPAQLAAAIHYYGAYAEAIERLYTTIQTIPNIGDTRTLKKPPIRLHYTTGLIDYLISEYDGKDTLWGKVRFYVYPNTTKYQKISLSSLKNNPSMKLDLSWVSGTKKS